jgi:hypothetical protein
MIKKQFLIIILLFSTKLVFSQFTIQQNFSNAGCSVIFYVYDIAGNVLTIGGPTPTVPNPTTCIAGIPRKVQIQYNGSTVFFDTVNAPSTLVYLTCNGPHFFYIDVSYVPYASSLLTCRDMLYLTI